MLDIERIHQAITWRYERWLLYPLYHLTQKQRVKKMRTKEKIKVLFVITEIGPWKTKELYEKMLVHPRFNPILGVSKSLENPIAKKALIGFLQEKKFDYVDLDDNAKAVFSEEGVDIIFYQKPYDFCYLPSILFKQHLNSLFCQVGYAFHSMDTTWSTNLPLYECVWQQYFENELTANPKRKAMLPDGGKQVVITGLPIQDQLMIPKEHFIDPWKKQAKPKKRIIYAPHHTIGDMHLKGLAISSFLENGESMLELMHKYSDEVQWAFKPHPLLYQKLVSIWGQEKTDKYYNEWKTAENSQFENGEYDALFKYSDAMIHDCSSFTIEYHYTNNPVLFLTRQKGEESNRNAFAQKAFDLHYKGYTKEDIAKFIQNVIDGIDPMKEERKKFYDDYLIPPHGKTACENIINAILGEAEYKDL